MANANNNLVVDQGLVTGIPEERLAESTSPFGTRAAEVTAGYISDFHIRFNGSIASTPNSTGGNAAASALASVASQSPLDVITFAGANTPFEVQFKYLIEYQYTLLSEFSVSERGGTGRLRLQNSFTLEVRAANDATVPNSTQSASFFLTDNLNPDQIDSVTGSPEGELTFTLNPGEKLVLNNVSLNTTLSGTGGTLFSPLAGENIYNAVSGNFTVNTYLWFDILSPGVTIASTSSPITASYPAPIPEPAAAAAWFGLAAVGFAYGRRRRRTDSLA